MAEKRSQDVESPTATQVASTTTIVDGAGLSSAADAEILAKMGYRQELRRNFSTLEVFGFGFAVIGLLPSIASTLAFSLPAGPAGLVWSWLLACCGIMTVGLALSDLASAMPTAGGLYYWTHFFAGENVRNYLAFLVGYSNTLGLIAGVCSVDYGFSLMLCSVVVIVTDGAWTPTNGVVYVVFMATVLTHAVLASTLSRVIGRLQTFFVVSNLALIVATVVALPLGSTTAHNDGRFIFAELQNLSGWPAGWNFMLAMLSPIWTVAGYDACVHMSEEALNAAKAVPLGILTSIGMGSVLGFVVVIVIAACMNPDVQSILSSNYGQPMAQIYYDALGKRATIGFMCSLFTVQYMMGLSVLVVTSRQSWAFSRDGALPISRFLRRVAKRMGYVPLNAVWFCTVISLILGLLCLIAPAASSALFSLCVVGLYSALLIPIASRAIWGRAKFVPGAFYTGRKLSIPVAVAACAICVFVIVLCMFPATGPNPGPDAMNYTVVICGAVWGGASLYFAVDAHKWFRGPRTTLGEESEG